MRSRWHATAMATVQFSRIAGGVRSPYAAPRVRHAHGDARRAPVSQSSTACRPPATAPQEGSAIASVCGRPGSVDVLGPTVARARPVWAGWLRRGAVMALPRKEVIQPQLPLRLPCYDFTPVTSPTVDGSLPCGLGHRLRVLLTPVV